MAFIERLQVDADGFLSGLDVRFTPGLNVLIGARGTGKTSVIELIRFALDAGSFTKEAGENGDQQARAILDGGSVTLTIRDGDARYVVTRSASMSRPRFEGPEFGATVLGQTEIEAVGAQRAGRLHLLDRFRPARDDARRRIAALESDLRSSTQEISDLISELDSLTSPEDELVVRVELEVARARQSSLMATSSASQSDQGQLIELQAAAQNYATGATLGEEALSVLGRVRGQLEATASAVLSAIPPWPSDGRDLLAELRGPADAVNATLHTAIQLVSSWQTQIASKNDADESARALLEVTTRELRQSLDSVTAGVSQAAQAVALLEEQVGQAAAATARRATKQQAIEDLVARRDEMFASLESATSTAFAERLSIATTLNEKLGPNIKIVVARSSGTDIYRGAIVSAMRGTGLHYNTLAPQVAAKVAPSELVRWVESRRVDDLAQALGVGVDRAAVILEALSDGTAEISASRIVDEVSVQLLDGRDYKSSDRLSIGQRCTVVLPILLAHEGDPLVLDQPEDHLDNAFITFTLVPALRQRGVDAQYIFSSHNANIPVLGDADNIVVMQSDGDRGFVQHQGALDSAPIVDSVKKILEGGEEAFEARALFYSRQRSDG